MPEGRDRKSSEKIRVMRIFSRLNIGGPSVHVVLLAEKLDRTIYDTTLVIGREGEREGSFEELARTKNIDPVTVPTLGRSIRVQDDLRSFLSLCGLMTRERPHIVHTHTAKAGALGRLAALVTGVPVVVHTFHGSVFTGYFGRIGSRAYAAAERRLARITDAVIGVSPAVSRELEHQRLEPRHGIHTVPLGLELDKFLHRKRSGALRRRLKVPDEGKLIGCVGRLVPIKSLPTLLEALSFSNLERAHLALIGDGPERAPLETLARELGLARRVHFTGFLSGLETIYPELDVVVNSSLNEGTPVALIEAMAAGAPVVATSVGGTPDLLQNGELGTLVPPDSPKMLSEAIAEALHPPGTTAKARRVAARAAVVARYRSERLVADLEALYRELLVLKGLKGLKRLKGLTRRQGVEGEGGGVGAPELSATRT